VVKAIFKHTSELISFPKLSECIQNVIGAIDGKMPFRVLVTNYKRYVSVPERLLSLINSHI